MRVAATFTSVCVLALACGVSSPEARKRPPWPHWWWRQAMCIHRAEAVNWHEKRNPVSRGGFQFIYSTWRAVIIRHHLRGFPRDPADATQYQQTLAAWLRWNDAGKSWSDWLPYDHAYHCVR